MLIPCDKQLLKEQCQTEAEAVAVALEKNMTMTTPRPTPWLTSSEHKEMNSISPRAI